MISCSLVDSNPLLEMDWNNFPVDTISLNCFIVVYSIVSSRWVPKINNQKDLDTAGLQYFVLSSTFTLLEFASVDTEFFHRGQ